MHAKAIRIWEFGNGSVSLSALLIEVRADSCPSNPLEINSLVLKIAFQRNSGLSIIVEQFDKLMPFTVR